MRSSGGLLMYFTSLNLVASNRWAGGCVVKQERGGSTAYKAIVAYGVTLVIVIVALFPADANAAFVREYTKGRFSFSGSVGFKYTERDRKTSSNTIRTTGVREVIDTTVKGFVWDPRFMVFKAGFAFRHETNKTEGGGESTPTSYQYTLFTTWLPKRRNPFVLHAHHIITEVKSDNAPTQEIVTDSFGMRWNMNRRTLGSLSFAYDTRMAKSFGGSTKRDQVDHTFKVDGARKFKKRRSKVGSDVNYSYTYELKKNRESDRETSEHRFNVTDKTTFSPKTELSADATYYYKEGSGASEFAVQSLRAGSRLSMNVSERLGVSYGLGMGAGVTDASNSQSASASAGLSYLISERWHTNASLSLSGNRTTAGGGEDRVSLSANGGVSYRQQWGIYNLTSNYGISLGSKIGTNERSMGHNFGIGLSQSNSILWSDNISYSLSYTESVNSIATSHGLTYGVRSQVSLRDKLYFTAGYKYLTEEDSSFGETVDREASSGRAELGWTHKYSFNTSLNASSSYQENNRDASDIESSDNQTTASSVAFRTSNFLGMRNVRFTSRIRYRQSLGKQRANSTKTTSDANFDYTLGRWITSLKLEHSTGETGLVTFENRSLTFNIKRIFGFRF